MGAGEHFFYHHHDMMKKDDHKMNIPKGCVTVMVGHEDGVQKRFVIPVMYMNHPLFMKLLKEAEEEYGFQHQGPVTLPCHVRDFCNVQRLIDKDHHHHHHTICCFKD